MGKVLGMVYRIITTHLIKKTGFSCKTAHTGTVTLIQRVAAGLTGLDVNIEHPLEPLRPGRRGAALGWRWLLSFIVAWHLLPLPRFAGVTRARCLLLGANTSWKRMRLTRGLRTKAASRAMKSSGSKITCVVPSRYGVFSS